MSVERIAQGLSDRFRLSWGAGGMGLGDIGPCSRLSSGAAG